MLTGITSAQFIADAQNKFINLRRALEDVQSLYAWSSAQSAADLQAIGFTVADANLILSACADANQLAVLYNGGGLGSYTLPFNFSAAQRQVIGPQ